MGHKGVKQLCQLWLIFEIWSGTEIYTQNDLGSTVSVFLGGDLGSIASTVTTLRMKVS